MKNNMYMNKFSRERTDEEDGFESSILHSTRRVECQQLKLFDE